MSIEPALIRPIKLRRSGMGIECEGNGSSPYTYLSNSEGVLSRFVWGCLFHRQVQTDAGAPGRAQMQQGSDLPDAEGRLPA